MTRLDEIRAELHGGGLSPVREAMLYRHAQVLQKQISKTDRILKKLEHPEE